MSISAIILTHNSEYSIAGIIKSLNWCDEVIIIDDDSIDQTRQIAKRFGAVI
jgi:glycosyltransferase involved in cell wall biosynthesis